MKYENIYNCKTLLLDNFVTCKYLGLINNCVSPPVLLLTIYPPPRLRRNFLEKNAELFSKMTTFDCMITSGDFNIHTDSSSSSDSGQLITLLKCFHFKQHVTEPSQTTGHSLHLIVSRGLSVPLRNVLHLPVRVMSVPAQLTHSPVIVQSVHEHYCHYMMKWWPTSPIQVL